MSLLAKRVLQVLSPDTNRIILERAQKEVMSSHARPMSRTAPNVVTHSAGGNSSSYAPYAQLPGFKPNYSLGTEPTRPLLSNTATGKDRVSPWFSVRNRKVHGPQEQPIMPNENAPSRASGERASRYVPIRGKEQGFGATRHALFSNDPPEYRTSLKRYSPNSDTLRSYANPRTGQLNSFHRPTAAGVKVEGYKPPPGLDPVAVGVHRPTENVTHRQVYPMSKWQKDLEANQRLDRLGRIANDRMAEKAEAAALKAAELKASAPVQPSGKPPSDPSSWNAKSKMADEIGKQAEMGHYQMVLYSKPAGKGNTAVDQAVKAATSAAPVTKNLTDGFGGAGSVFAGAMLGGGAGYIGSDQESRGFGAFAKGAVTGAIGGALVSGVAARGMISGAADYAGTFAKNHDLDEASKFFSDNANRAHMGLESAESRAMLFGGGAMLSGAMFGTRRNRASGINANRGNRFGG